MNVQFTVLESPFTQKFDKNCVQQKTFPIDTFRRFDLKDDTFHMSHIDFREFLSH